MAVLKKFLHHYEDYLEKLLLLFILAPSENDLEWSS